MNCRQIYRFSRRGYRLNRNCEPLKTGLINPCTQLVVVPIKIIRLAGLFDIDCDGIRRTVVSRQQNVDFAFASQTARNAHVGLIKSGKIRRCPCVKHFGIFVADHHYDTCRTCRAKSAAEQNQKELIALRPQVNRQRDKPLLLRIVSRQRLVGLCVAANAQKQSSRHTLAAGVG